MGSCQSCFCSPSHLLREKPQEWGFKWNYPISPCPLASLSNTHYARCIPTNECKGDTETAMEVGEFEEDSLTKPRTLPPRLIYWADRLLPDRRGTGWWSCFCYVPLAGVRKSTNKQGDLTRRNISTPSKRKKNPWIPPPESTIAWVRSRQRCQPWSIKVKNSLRRGFMSVVS